MTEPDPPLANATPVPVQALAYSDPSGPRKPGLVVAIGVLGIVIACLSGIANLIFAGSALVRYQMARAYSTYAATVAPASAPAVVAPNMGLKMGDATVVVTAVQPLIGLDGARVRELDKMMRAHGKDIFLLDDDKEVTPEAITGLIREHKAADSPSGPATFVVEGGRVEVYADRAVFTSTEGSRKIETSAVKNSDTDTGAASATHPADSTLTAAQVRRVMNAVKQGAQPAPTASQLSTIQSQISATNQQLVNPQGTTPVTQVTVTPQGAAGNQVMVQFDYGMLTIGPRGEVTSMTSYAPAVAAAMGAPVWTPPPINRASIFLTFAEAAASELLAVYLLIVSIMVFRFSFSSPRMLRIYAWVKIPLALLAGVAVWAFEPGAQNFGYASLIVALGVAYPIGVLIALRSQSLREFFTPMSAA